MSEHEKYPWAHKFPRKKYEEFQWSPTVPKPMREYWEAAGLDRIFTVPDTNAPFSLSFYIYLDPVLRWKYPQCRPLIHCYNGSSRDGTPLTLPERRGSVVGTWLDFNANMYRRYRDLPFLDLFLRYWKASPRALTLGTYMVNPMRKAEVLEE